MSGESLRDKQKRIRLEDITANVSDEGSYSGREKKQENSHLDDANREWRRFYEVIKEITSDMRY
ncbi:hypothetical protein [Paenibacillus prosopidis]|uniref:Uncharacterized protein n=1 Tax=Paenibacillus prosopidis TaxID=630520 RepID=A0A368VPH4_9BACL|nr:hypothetical protein [Paenibacillus prosopidis]RCW43420.1 hypothetical protein DFP97_11392 [Paenibacillus prosopidis]